jgi:DNA-binding MarR family transcriptional regulator
MSARSKEALRLWLRMLAATSLIEGVLKQRLKQHFNVTLAQFDLMAEIARGGQPKTMSELSQLLMVSNGNVTGVADRLSREGLLERLPSERDRRVTLLALTPKGEALFEEMASAHETWLNELLEDLSDDDITHLNQRLRALKAAVQRASEAHP